MSYLTIFLLALSLAMDAFAVSITNGMTVSGFRKQDALRQGIFFGAFQFFMPIIGWFLGSSVRQYIEAVDHWIAFLLLAAIGGNMVWESLKKEDTEDDEIAQLSTKKLFVQAIATSIDALAIGISLAVLDAPVLSSAAIIGVVALILSFLGGILGRSVGGFLKQKTEFLGGLVLILIGCKILVEHLFFAA